MRRLIAAIRLAHPRERSFREAQGGQVAASSITKDALLFRIPLAPSRDGNTVETHVEEAAYGDAAGRYLAALRFAEGALSGMRKAYRGD